MGTEEEVLVVDYRMVVQRSCVGELEEGMQRERSWTRRQSDSEIGRYRPRSLTLWRAFWEGARRPGVCA